jgi:hypothetical protein
MIRMPVRQKDMPDIQIGGLRHPHNGRGVPGRIHNARLPGFLASDQVYKVHHWADLGLFKNHPSQFHAPLRDKEYTKKRGQATVSEEALEKARITGME